MNDSIYSILYPKIREVMPLIPTRVLAWRRKTLELYLEVGPEDYVSADLRLLLAYINAELARRI